MTRQKWGKQCICTETEITDRQWFFLSIYKFPYNKDGVFFPSELINCSENVVVLRFLCMDFVVLFVCLKEWIWPCQTNTSPDTDARLCSYWRVFYISAITPCNHTQSVAYLVWNTSTDLCTKIFVVVLYSTSVIAVR